MGIYYYSFSNFYYFCNGFQYGGVGEWRGEGGFITTFSVIFIIFGVYSSTPVVKITPPPSPLTTKIVIFTIFVDPSPSLQK